MDKVLEGDGLIGGLIDTEDEHVSVTGVRLIKLPARIMPLGGSRSSCRDGLQERRNKGRGAGATEAE